MGGGQYSPGLPSTAGGEVLSLIDNWLPAIASPLLAQAPSLTASGTGFPLLLPFPPLTLLPRELLSFPGQMTLGQAFTFTGSEIGAIITPILQAGKLRCSFRLDALAEALRVPPLPHLVSPGHSRA